MKFSSKRRRHILKIIRGMYGRNDPRRFGADSTGVEDSTSAFMMCAITSFAIEIPPGKWRLDSILAEKLGFRPNMDIRTVVLTIKKRAS